MIKKITTIITSSQGSAVRRAIVIAGTAVGAIIADSLLAKATAEKVEGVVVEEQVVEPDNTEAAPKTED